MSDNCPACGWTVAQHATRCPHCTSILDYESKTGVARTIGGLFGSVGGMVWGAIYGLIAYAFIVGFMNSEALGALIGIAVFALNIWYGHRRGTVRKVARF